MQVGPKNKMIIFLLLTVFWTTGSLSFAAALKWDPPSQGTATGFIVHYGKSSAAPTTSVNVGNSTQYDLNSAPLVGNTTY
ncbi:MAG: hypothetical protein WAK57_17240, partial [Desulfobacterales bacterium]